MERIFQQADQPQRNNSDEHQRDRSVNQRFVEVLGRFSGREVSCSESIRFFYVPARGRGPARGGSGHDLVGLHGACFGMSVACVIVSHMLARPVVSGNDEMVP